jgi:diguanylate cyclase (GGDEF)-like protein
MRQQYLNRFIFFLMALLVVFAIYLQYKVIESTNKLKNEEIKKSEQYAQKIANYIQSKIQIDDVELTLTRDPKLRQELNKILQTFLTQQYQYIYLLKKDHKGHFRFLLDGSKDPEVFNAIFFPKSELFNEVCKTHKMQIIKQQDGVEKVWLSLVYPIFKNNKTEALLVLDLSESYGKYLNDFNSPLMSVIEMMQIFLLGSLLLLLFIVYKYNKFRKSILIDKLTSAHTKLYLEEFFNRHNVDKYNAILIDIDDFKQINIQYGHVAGNKILTEFVKTISNIISPLKSKVIRTSGAEFLIIIPKDTIKIELLAKKLFKILKEKKYLIHNEVASLTVSMSAIVIPKETPTMKNILRLLDEKLLEIKSKGKDNLGILGLRQLNEVQYGNMDYIKEALEEERLLCLYQPIYDTRKRKVVKYEALVRLIDKDDSSKLITPYHFMKVIKGTSQYIKMSKLVLNEVFATLKRYPNVELSVNLDLDDLYNSDMMGLIIKNLYQHRDIAERLTFEILEEKEIYDYDKVSLIFQQLKAHGSKIAIDDFGSGYANYNYLIRLDIDILKIDGSLIRELHTESERTKTVLTSIKKLASTFQYELVAEFVSDESIYKIMKELGIEYSQGYYLGEPKPIEEYID